MECQGAIRRHLLSLGSTWRTLGLGRTTQQQRPAALGGLAQQRAGRAAGRERLQLLQRRQPLPRRSRAAPPPAAAAASAAAAAAANGAGRTLLASLLHAWHANPASVLLAAGAFVLGLSLSVFLMAAIPGMLVGRGGEEPCCQPARCPSGACAARPCPAALLRPAPCPCARPRRAGHAAHGAGRGGAAARAARRGARHRLHAAPLRPGAGRLHRGGLPAQVRPAALRLTHVEAQGVEGLPALVAGQRLGSMRGGGGGTM